MKYTIEGFSQVEAIRLGLDVKDMVLLRWMLDFQSTGKMEILISGTRQWYWVHYPYVLKELPILKIGHDKVLARRIRNLEASGVIDVLRTGGRNYFRFGEKAMLALLSDSEKQQELFDRKPVKSARELKSSKGNLKVPKENLKVPKTELKSSDNIDSSINDSSIKDKRGKFHPPTLEEVKAYCQKRGNKINPVTFFNHYEAGEWMRGKTKIRNWKACVITWEEREKDPTSQAAGTGKPVIDYKGIENRIEKELEKIATDDMIKAVMRGIPEKVWWMVDKFLKKKYPNGGGTPFCQIETELIRERKNEPET